MNSGVYAIKSLATGRMYVGQSRNLRVRWQHHRGALSAGRHYCRSLQADWDTFGAEAFEFVVLEAAKAPYLVKRERYWMARYRSLLYNVSPRIAAAQPRRHSRHPKGWTVEQRFWAMVRRDVLLRPALGPCWIWTGARAANGYGDFRDRGVPERRAHRIVWHFIYGPVPPGKWVLHRCDIRLCVRPEHLFLGDRRANTDDMVAKGRQGHANYPGKNAGQRHGMSKLSDAQAHAIAARRRAGEKGRTLAREYGVSEATISMIASGKTRNHSYSQVIR